MNFASRAATSLVFAAAVPCLAEGASKWKKIWVTSAAVLAATHVADVTSSRGMPEANPLLRDARGQFHMSRGILIKGAASGGLLVLQGILLKRSKDSNLYKPFSVINLGAAGAVGATALRNHRMRGEPFP
ncbi:MAG: hypothetical protein K6T59_03045 [Bryobacteraceae bacterium]|nr:hypothetical protein [Bryobacteraceae bacterium]